MTDFALDSLARAELLENACIAPYDGDFTTAAVVRLMRLMRGRLTRLEVYSREALDGQVLQSEVACVMEATGRACEDSTFYWPKAFDGRFFTDQFVVRIAFSREPRV